MNLDYTNLLDLAFVVDSSVSVGQSNFAKTIDFIGGIAKVLPIDTRKARVAAVTYSNAASVRVYLSSFVTKTDLLRRIKTLEYDRGSMTNAAEAIRVLREDVFNVYRGDRPTATNVAILITDGVSNMQPRQTMPEAQKARDSGIHMYAIGIGLNASREINGIAPIENSLTLVDSYDDLEKLGESLLNKISKLKPLIPVTTARSSTSPAPLATHTRPTLPRVVARTTPETTTPRFKTALPPTKPTTEPKLAPG